MSTLHYMVGLSPRERQTFDFIREKIMATGISPTYDEIRQHLGISSKSGVFRLVKALVKRNMLTAARHGKKRSLCIVNVDHAPGDVLTCRDTGMKLVYVGPVHGDMIVVYPQDDDPNDRNFFEVAGADFEYQRAA